MSLNDRKSPGIFRPGLFHVNWNRQLCVSIAIDDSGICNGRNI